MKDLTSQFTVQPNGTYSYSMPGCKGILKVEFAPGTAKPWVKVIRLMPGSKTPKSSLHQSRGAAVALKLFYPSMAQLTLVCDAKPKSVTLVEFEGETSSSSEDITEITNTIQEQVIINEQQQQQIDEHKTLDEKQQQQIDANTTIINQIAGGIGEEAAKALVDKVFGTPAS